jgi:hypothetical protein
MTADEIRAWLADNADHDRKPASCNQLALLCEVGRAHLSLVLSGDRTSAPLLEKIQAIYDAQQARRTARRKR